MKRTNAMGEMICYGCKTVSGNPGEGLCFTRKVVVYGMTYRFHTRCANKILEEFILAEEGDWAATHEKFIEGSSNG